MSPDLPLFCGVTGARISEEQDKRIEVLRDALMDAARSRVEELGEDAVAGRPDLFLSPCQKLCIIWHGPFHKIAVEPLVSRLGQHAGLKNLLLVKYKRLLRQQIFHMRQIS